MSVTQTIQNGAVLSAPVTWSATSTTAVSKIEFYIDGVLKWTEGVSPYVFNGDGNKLNPATLTQGSHEFKVVAYPGPVQAVATATVGIASWEQHVRSVAASLSLGEPYTLDQVADVLRKLLAGLA